MSKKLLTIDLRNKEQADKLSKLVAFNITVGFAYSFGIQMVDEEVILKVSEEISNIVESIDNDEITNVATYVSEKSVDIFYTEGNIYDNLEKHGLKNNINILKFEAARGEIQQSTFNEILQLHNQIKWTNVVKSVASKYRR
jgi:hypothetical protein